MITTQTELDALKIPIWYLPSFHGDIRLVTTGEKTCDLVMTKLSPSEEKAIVQLSAIATKKGWTTGVMVPTATTVSLQTPIDRVAKALAKLLKPERTTITAVVFADGAMAEVRGPIELSSRHLLDDDDVDGPPPATGPTDAEVLVRKRPKAKAAVSVAAPVRGCPAPDFTAADLRAKDVLRTFLRPEQVADFNRYNKFVSVGATTGNHYMITSRHARDELAKYTRTLFDLDRRLPLCVHDWDVPAAEEMLTLHLLLQLPGWEQYLRVTEDNLEQVLAAHLEDAPCMQVVYGPFGDPDHDHGPDRMRPSAMSSLTVQAAAQRGLI